MAPKATLVLREGTFHLKEPLLVTHVREPACLLASDTVLTRSPCKPQMHSTPTLPFFPLPLFPASLRVGGLPRHSAGIPGRRRGLEWGSGTERVRVAQAHAARPPCLRAPARHTSRRCARQFFMIYSSCHLKYSWFLLSLLSLSSPFFFPFSLPWQASTSGAAATRWPGRRNNAVQCPTASPSPSTKGAAAPIIHILLPYCPLPVTVAIQRSKSVSSRLPTGCLKPTPLPICAIPVNRFFYPKVFFSCFFVYVM